MKTNIDHLDSVLSPVVENISLKGSTNLTDHLIHLIQDEHEKVEVEKMSDSEIFETKTQGKRKWV